jgi:predicted dehydrogenase
MIKVGIIGYGHWGPNLVRAFHTAAGSKVVVVADARPERQAALLEKYPDIEVCEEGLALIQRPDVDAVVIATPTYTHYNLAKLAIENGKHLLVEKPLTNVASEANDLVELAERFGLTLMVDHILLYTGVAQKMAEIVQQGAIGNLKYYDATRYAFGLFQPDVNVLWDLAPHDIAVMLHLQAERPVSVNALGACHTGNGIENHAHLTINYASGFVATFRCSWSVPYKLRLTLVGGDKGVMSWDDMLPEEKLRVYDCNFDHQVIEAGKRISVQYNQAGYSVPTLDPTEPLMALANDFAYAIINKVAPQSSGALGAEVVKILEAAELSIKNQGKAINLH